MESYKITIQLAESIDSLFIFRLLHQITGTFPRFLWKPGAAC